MEEKEERRELIDSVESLINRDRVLSFSDAIFAFAATLLILKIDIPSLPATEIEYHLTNALLQLWPAYLANIISFLIIGYYWVTHHAIFNILKKYNHTLLWINVLFLICISFLPFPVDLFGKYHQTTLIVVFYSASLALCGYLLVITWLYVSHNYRLIDKSLSARRIQFYTIRFLIAPMVFTLSAGIAFLDVTVAKFSWLFVLFGVWAIDRIYRYKRIDIL